MEDGISWRPFRLHILFYHTNWQRFTFNSSTRPFSEPREPLITPPHTYRFRTVDPTPSYSSHQANSDLIADDYWSRTMINASALIALSAYVARCTGVAVLRVRSSFDGASSSSYWFHLTRRRTSSSVRQSPIISARPVDRGTHGWPYCVLYSGAAHRPAWHALQCKDAHRYLCLPIPIDRQQ